MNKINLRPIITVEDKNTFVSEIQEAFQDSYVSEFGKYEKTILPIEDIEESFNTKGSEAYIAEIDGERVGGTIVVIDDTTGYNSLHLLYVKSDAQNTGNGFKIWKAIEELHPETRIWETHTPYCDKRNIHFYVNRCGFKIVEFFNPKHKDPHQISETAGNIPKENNYFFRFEKEMKQPDFNFYFNHNIEFFRCDNHHSGLHHGPSAHYIWLDFSWIGAG